MTGIFNPYDFANPVTNMTVFADRIHEREEIDYYLDSALNAPRHINIALIGQRASGKTSLLNYIECTARSKNFITCRIDLDEENVASSYAFFFKIFDVLVNEAVKAGYLGGTKGKFIDVYKDVTCTFKTDVDPEWAPFSFPFTYAKVMGAGTAKLAPFPDNDFAADLDRLWKEGGRKFCLIFDECDLLGSSRGVLQKLRNIIQKSTGFMFVFAGTPKLFPVMDDVFSPIARQFKKIEVRDFVEIDDTRECILNPLKILDDHDPEEFFDFDNLRLIQDIHTLTSGRPYEVQLLCHSMFKRVQQHHSAKMSLDIAVVEDVQNQLVSGHSLQERPLIKAVRKLSRDELNKLRFFCITCEGAELHQIIATDNVILGSLRTNEQEIQQAQVEFEELGLISVEGNLVRFAGDALDRIYTKYYAREKKVAMPFIDGPLDVIIPAVLQSELGKVDGVVVFFSQNHRSIEEMVQEWNAFVDKFSGNDDPFSGAPRSIFRIYFSMVGSAGKDRVTLHSARIDLPWTECLITWFSRTSENECDNGRTYLETKREAIEASGGSLTFEQTDLPIVSVEALVERLSKSSNERLRTRIVREHEQHLGLYYVSRRDIIQAEMHANCIEKLPAPLEPAGTNNVGYLFLRLGKYELAAEKLRAARERVDRVAAPDGYLLTSYNLALAEVACGNHVAAMELLDECIDFGKSVPVFKRQMGCLLQLATCTQGEVTYVESFDKPDVWHFARECREKLKEYTGIGHHKPDSCD